jgi:hypothetical protein
MIKAAIRDLVRSRLLQVDKTSKYHDEIIDHWISMAFNQILGQLFRKGTANWDLYTKRYNGVVVAQDPITDIYYSEFPAPIIQTIDVAEGVRRINTTKGRGLQFAPVSGDNIQILDDLDVNLVDDVIGYRVFADRVEYWGNPGVATVRMELVIPFTAYEEMDDVKIPGGSDAQLIEVVLQFVQGTPPKDLKNNNADQWQTQQE